MTSPAMPLDPASVAAAIRSDLERVQSGTQIAAAKLASARSRIGDLKAVVVGLEHDLDEPHTPLMDAAASAVAAKTRAETLIPRRGAAHATILFLAGLVFVGPGPSPVLTSPVEARPVKENDLDRASALHRAGKYLEAQALYQKAADAGADPVSSLGGVAECLLNRHLYDECRKVCQRLSERVPNCGRGHYLIGCTWHLQGQREKALVEFRLAASHGSPEAAVLLSPMNIDKLGVP